MDTSIMWGAAFSLATSIAKAFKMPDRWAFAVNILAALIYGAVLMVYYHEALKQAGLDAAVVLLASYGFYQTVTKPGRQFLEKKG